MDVGLVAGLVSYSCLSQQGSVLGVPCLLSKVSWDCVQQFHAQWSHMKEVIEGNTQDFLSVIGQTFTMTQWIWALQQWSPTSGVQNGYRSVGQLNLISTERSVSIWYFERFYCEWTHLIVLIRTSWGPPSTESDEDIRKRRYSAKLEFLFSSWQWDSS